MEQTAALWHRSRGGGTCLSWPEFGGGKKIVPGTLKPQASCDCGWPLRTAWGFPAVSDGKESAYNQETQVQSLVWEDPLEKEMATLSSILAWRIPWMEEPGVL